MKTKIFTTLFILLGQLLAVNAQTPIPDQPIEYVEDHNDPATAVSKVYVGLEPFFMDFNGTNGVAMGWGLYGFYHINQDLMFSGRFQTAYWHGFVDGAYLSATNSGSNKKPDPTTGKTNMFNSYNPAQLMYIDLNASWKILRKDMFDRNVKIHLSTGGTDINNYIDGIKGTKRYQLMGRGGTLIRSTTIPLKNLPDEANTWPTSGKPYSKMLAVSLYGGIGFHKMWEVVANITELNIGKKIARMHKSTYIDLMYAPMMSFADLEQEGVNPVSITADPKDSTKSIDHGYLAKSQVGFRFGSANMPEYKNNLSGWEVGVFPSFKSSSQNFTGVFFKWWYIIDLHSSED